MQGNGNVCAGVVYQRASHLPRESRKQKMAAMVLRLGPRNVPESLFCSCPFVRPSACVSYLVNTITRKVILLDGFSPVTRFGEIKTTNRSDLGSEGQGHSHQLHVGGGTQYLTRRVRPFALAQ